MKTENLIFKKLKEREALRKKTKVKLDFFSKQLSNLKDSYNKERRAIYHKYIKSINENKKAVYEMQKKLNEL